MKNRGQEGFTLLEVLVALTILMFGLMAVVSMINVAYLSAERSKNTTRAAELAAWMIDRVSLETSSPLQPYTTDVDRLLTLDNSPAPGIICDTTIAGDPVSEPGKTICSQWRALIRPAIQNASTALPGGVGVVTILPNDPTWDGNHVVIVQVFWQITRSGYGDELVGLELRRRVQLMTVLAASE